MPPSLVEAFHIAAPDQSFGLIQCPTAVMGAFRVSGQTILLVEDEDSVRRVTSLVLQSNGYRTLEATDGRHGLAVFLREREEVDLVLSDIEMPQHRGPEMIQQILSASPQTRVAFMSGTPAYSIVPDELKSLPLLRKPFRARELLDFIESCLHGDDRESNG